MHRFLVFALLLLASTAHANPILFWQAMHADSTAAFTINGYSSISSTGTLDTGTESKSTGAGNITVDASCVSTNTAGNQSDVNLVVDGVATSLICAEGETKSSTLTKAVTAGSHTVQVFGNLDTPGTDSFSANNFRKP